LHEAQEKPRVLITSAPLRSRTATALTFAQEEN